MTAPLNQLRPGETAAPNDLPHLAGYIEGMGVPATLDEAIRQRNCWIESAAQFSRNEEYYRGLLDQIAESLGPDAYMSDDGSTHDSPVRAKLPEIVADRLGKNPPAFPSACLSDPGHPASVPGMTLRDWFAGRAPVTLFDAAVACGWTGLEAAEMHRAEYRAALWAGMALMRYEHADALLAARATTEPQS